MARYNKIFLGPVDKAKPQVREAIADADILPGTLAVLSSGEFVAAGAATSGRYWVIQDNYLLLKGVDDAWKAGDTAIGIEPQDDQILAGRIPTGVNITAVGTPLTFGADGKLAIGVIDTNLIVGFADEIYNNNTGADQLIKFRSSGLISTDVS